MLTVALALALAAYARVTCRFGVEEVTPALDDRNAFVHQGLTWAACESPELLGGERPRDLSGPPEDLHTVLEELGKPANDVIKTLAWHTDSIDSYLYSPFFWAGGLVTGDGLDRLKVAVCLRKELESVHFDDLTHVDQIEAMWTRYLSGCLAGLFWAADRGDVAAAHNILGTTLHAIQDFYAHSNWVDDKERRATPWHAMSPDARSKLNLYTGSYETQEHLSQRPHGKPSLECSLMRASGLAPVMRIACHDASPLSKLAPCEVYRRCRDAETVRTNVLGVRLPAGLVYVDPPGIALDSSWQAEIARQLRDIPGNDPVTAQELYQAAKSLAVESSVWWLKTIDKMMATDPDRNAFWRRVLTTGTFGSRLAQFEDFSRLPLLFVAAGNYPPKHEERAWDWFLRLHIRTSSDTDAGTNGKVQVRAGGFPAIDLDYGSDANAVVEYNDFSTGDVQCYVVGPFSRLPSTLTFSVQGKNVEDLFEVIWEGLVGAVGTLIETLRDLLLSIIGGHADFVAREKHEWTPQALKWTPSGGGMPFVLQLNGGSRGVYFVLGSISRVEDPPPPRRHAKFAVRLRALWCLRESSEWSARDEPFVLAVLVNLAERDPEKRVQARRTQPFSMNAGGPPAQFTLEFDDVTVPDESGMLVLALAIFDSDLETSAMRDACLAEFAGAAKENTQSWSDRFVETVGAMFGSDWKLGGLHVHAFNRAPVFASSAALFGSGQEERRIEQWVDAGSSRTFELDPDPTWTRWSLPGEYILNPLLDFSMRAERLLADDRFAEAQETVRRGVGQLASISHLHPEIPLAEQVAAAETWMHHAWRAHVNDVPRQLAAAAVSLELCRFLGDRRLPDPRLKDDEFERVIVVVRRLVSFATWGAPDSGRSVVATDLAIRMYEQLADRSHLHNIATCLADLSLRQHETAHHPECPDRDAELARQRETASRALAVAQPVVAGLPDPSIPDHELYSFAAGLRHLVGTATFGAADSAPSVLAADLAVRVFGLVAERDVRYEIGETWRGLALRRHEIRARDDCPDKPGELAGQVAAARMSADVLLALVDDLPHPAYGPQVLGPMVTVLEQVAGFLTAGLPADHPDRPALEALAERAQAAAREISQLVGG